MSHWLRITWMTAFLISCHLTSQARRQRKLVPVVLILAQAPQVLGRHLRRGNELCPEIADRQSVTRSRLQARDTRQ